MQQVRAILQQGQNLWANATCDGVYCEVVDRGADVDVTHAVLQWCCEVERDTAIGLAVASSDDHMGEDMRHCKEIAKNGYKVMIDNELSRKVGHVGSMAYTHNLVEPNLE